jgi:putative endonuclease
LLAVLVFIASCAGLTRASIVPQVMEVAYYVYIFASKKNGTLYIGVTNDLVRRVLRERTMKHWRRDWKVVLIEKDNPDWHDLYESIAT